MTILHNGKQIYMSYEFVRERVRKAFAPFGRQLNWRIDYAKSSSSIYVSFYWRGVFHKIRISDHDPPRHLYIDLDIRLVDGGEPHIKTKIRDYLNEIIKGEK